MTLEVSPLITFIHVPKTAGSFVNSELENWRSGRNHIENIIENRRALREACREAAWVSGHVPVSRMMQAVCSVTARPLRLCTLIREPAAQIASHYNWLIEIHHRGGAFYEGHPEEIKRISSKIRASDNSNPDAIVENLSAFSGLFLNQQCRIVLGFDVSGWCMDNIKTALRLYDCVLPERRRNDFLKEISKGEIEPRQEVVNKATAHFDRRVFESETVRAFLRERHDGDARLFDAVSRQEDD